MIARPGAPTSDATRPPVAWPLAARFFGLRAAVGDVSTREELETALRDAYATGRERWPDVSYDADAFSAALGARWDTQSDPTTWVRRLHAADLFLAQACVAHDVAALAAFKDEILGPARRRLLASKELSSFVREAEQQLLVRLVAPIDGSEAKLSTYRGDGPLIAWVRIALTRLAINLRETSGRQQTLDGDVVEPLAEGDPELELLRQTYAGELEAGVKAALAAAGAEERTLLRMHFMDGLSVAEIAALFRVTPRTIQRRIAEARTAILDRLREGFRERFGGNTSLFATLVRLMGADLNLSLRTAFRDVARQRKSTKKS